MKTCSLKNAASKLTLLLCAAMLAATLDSCDKDEVMPTPESLNGTTWEGKAVFKTTDASPETEYLLTLSFTSATALKYVLSPVGGGDALTFNGTYEYVKPLLTMTLVVVSSGSQQVTSDAISGAVDGRKMTIRTLDGKTATLTRK